MCTGIDGLSLHVQQALGRPPCYDTAYVFANRRRTRLKLVCWDGIGVWMYLRRLHRGHFFWPQTDDACWPMSAEPSRWLVAGVDWQRRPSGDCKLRSMNPLDDLARTDIDPALLAQVQAKLAEKDFKIAALTHELACYRRIRFGKACANDHHLSRLLGWEKI